MVAIVLALATALCWAMTGILAVEGTKRINPLVGSFVSQLSNIPVTFVVVAALGRLGFLDQFGLYQVLMLILAGVLNYVAGRTFLFYAVRAVGAAKAQPITQLQVLASQLLAALILQEVVSARSIVGIGLAT